MNRLTGESGWLKMEPKANTTCDGLLVSTVCDSAEMSDPTETMAAINTVTPLGSCTDIDSVMLPFGTTHVIKCVAFSPTFTTFPRVCVSDVDVSTVLSVGICNACQ